MNPETVFQIAGYMFEEATAQTDKHRARYHTLVEDIFFGGIDLAPVKKAYVESLLKSARMHIKNGDRFTGRLFIRVALDNAFAI